MRRVCLGVHPFSLARCTRAPPRPLCSPTRINEVGTPCMTTTLAHQGRPPHMGTALSPHHMNGLPAHHQGDPHQPPHHLVDLPAHMGLP
ncbi:hypothetical protein FS749_015119 [Ceratobasidium sp. UAMH 11750]|nr:hypothetical protein FS749_015119 [Ceratobasidium sp. UAMH 11750]